ncbi:MAG: AmmeMemoRadiSam system protein B [Candidatus Heimdallarchaeota archaeon]|nr:MAG: AmmeMemoRadiSam system protein B [Candidatus Heimdallarchaeota archaeon]
MRVRTAVRAGSWYSGQKDRLLNEINAMYMHKIGPGRKPLALDQRKDVKNILGVVSPHAGYACSAPTAAHGFIALAEDRKEINTVILLGNKHTPYGPEISVAPFDAWETPLGQVPVNMSLLNRIIDNKQQLPDRLSKILDFDDTAHMDEHSIELQIPFLQDIYSDFKIAPIGIGRLPTNITRTFGYYLAEMIKEEGIGDSSVAIASTDMTHGNYSPVLNHDEVSSLDKLALTPMLNRDPEALEEAVQKNNISMCGVGPVKVLLSFAEKLGAKSAKLLNYSTSGLTCGPRSSVVGYASVAVMKSGD